MDWQRAIEINQAALLRILTALIHSLGLTIGGTLTTLPFHIYRKALLIIRPAESALRRLIMLAAYDMELRGVKLRTARNADHSDFSFARTQHERLPSFNLIDPLKTFGAQLPDFASFGATFNNENNDEQSPHARINAAALSRRLLALKNALASIPKQARRLARWYSQRDLAHAQNQPHRFSPLRPGPALGFRKAHRHEIDTILVECHGLAIYARERRDST